MRLYMKIKILLLFLFVAGCDQNPKPIPMPISISVDESTKYCINGWQYIGIGHSTIPIFDAEQKLIPCPKSNSATQYTKTGQSPKL